MDAVRFGRVVRALRQRQGWRQIDLAERARVSQSVVARIERAGARRVAIRRLEAVGEALGARLTIRLDWNGEAGDRLLDADHAALVEHVVATLRRLGWEAVPEVTFAIRSERGSIDILAWHEDSATLLVVEVKTVVPDVQAMLSTHDRKLRLADLVARERGWRPGRIGSLLVIREATTARRRVEQHGATFDARFPDRGPAVRTFLERPGAGSRAVRGLWFLPLSRPATTRHRVARKQPAA
jgi:transcriptional regulator with XRE-family HTH domain